MDDGGCAHEKSERRAAPGRSTRVRTGRGTRSDPRDRTGAADRPPLATLPGRPPRLAGARGEGERDGNLPRRGRIRRHREPADSRGPRVVVRSIRLPEESGREWACGLPQCLRGPDGRPMKDAPGEARPVLQDVHRGVVTRGADEPPRGSADALRGLAKVVGLASRLLPLRFEERPLDDRGRHPMALPLDRHLDLDLRPEVRVRRRDRGDRDVFLQDWRPAAARGPADLTIPRVEWYLVSPRLRWRLRREPHLPIVPLDRSPIDVKPDRAPGRSASVLLEERLPPDERPFVERHSPVE